MILIIGIIVTGILISNYLFKGLSISGRGLIKKVHKFFSWWSLIIIAIHLGLHIKIFVINIINKFKNLKNNKKIRIFILLIYLITSVYGISVLANEHVYKNFIPNFSTNHKNKNIGNHYLEEKVKKHKNRQNNEEHQDNINLIGILSVMILFTGGTYYILNIKKD